MAYDMCYTLVYIHDGLDSLTTETTTILFKCPLKGNQAVHNNSELCSVANYCRNY